MTSQDGTGRGLKIGLALAGGGPEGAVYEIGVLRALDEALEGLDLNDLHVYVGVSAGAFLSANLVNQLTPSQMCRALVKPDAHPFHPQMFFVPAVTEYVQRGMSVPRLMLEALGEWLDPRLNHSLAESMTRLLGALPVAIFDNEPIRRYLESIYTMKGRSDDFRELRQKLFIIAADLDSGQAVRFGEPGLDHIPISRAIQASSALPGVYPPVEIEGRSYVDGVLLKTLHASVALDADADLVICVNPIVPVDTARAAAEQLLRRPTLAEQGLPSVMSQTFRTLIHSRLTVGMAAYEPRYPNRDLVLFEPKRDDYLMFYTNIFSFSSRTAVCELAYQSTRRDLLERYDELAPIFARHGIRLRREVLEDENRDLWKGVGVDDVMPPVTQQLDRTLARLEKLVAQIENGKPVSLG